METEKQCSKSQYLLITKLLAQLVPFVTPAQLKSIKHGSLSDADQKIRQLRKQIEQQRKQALASADPDTATASQIRYLQDLLQRLNEVLDDDELHALRLSSKEHLTTVISSAMKRDVDRREQMHVVDGVPLPKWLEQRGLVDHDDLERRRQQHRLQIEEKRLRDYAERGMTFSAELPI